MRSSAPRAVSPTSGSERLRLLDALRGAAALAVVVFHWQHFWFGPDYQLPDDFTREALPLFSVLRPIYNHGWIAVDLFFMLSGFIFFWKYRDAVQSGRVTAGRFFLLRFARLYPLHAATLGVVAVLQILFYAENRHYFVTGFNDWYHLLLNLGFASHWGLQSGFSFNTPSWSLSIEVMLYAMFFVLAALGATRPWQVCLLAVFGVTLYASLGLDIGRGIMCFFLGGSIYHLLQCKCIEKNKLYIISILPIVFIVGVLLAEIYKNNAIVLYLCFTLISFPSAIIFLLLAEDYFSSMVKYISWLGDISYSSYLLHFPLQIGMIFAIGMVLGGDADLYRSEGLFIAFFAVLILASLGCYRWFERPVQRAIIHRFSGSRADGAVSLQPKRGRRANWAIWTREVPKSREG